jgi:hypothetical protein
VGDGQALWEFIRVWAAAARGGSPALPGLLPSVFDRAVINSHPKAEAVSRTFLRIFAPALPMVSCSVNSACLTASVAVPSYISFFSLIAVENEDTGQTFLNHCDPIKLAQ